MPTHKLASTNKPLCYIKFIYMVNLHGMFSMAPAHYETYQKYWLGMFSMTLPRYVLYIYGQSLVALTYCAMYQTNWPSLSLLAP